MQLRAIKGIPEVMTGPILYVLDHGFIPGKQVQNFPGNLQIRFLMSTTNIVDLSVISAFKQELYSPAMIVYVDPVTDIFPGAVDRYFLPIEQIRHKKWYKFFRELVGSEIICATGDDYGQVICGEV